MSIYNIALYAAIAVISLVFAGGLYCFALILLKVPAKRTTNAIKSIASRNRPSAAGFKNTYNDIALFVSRFIHLNEFKKKELPYRFAWQELAPISLKLDVKSQWRALF